MFSVNVEEDMESGCSASGPAVTIVAVPVPVIEGAGINWYVMAVEVARLMLHDVDTDPTMRKLAWQTMLQAEVLFQVTLFIVSRPETFSVEGTTDAVREINVMDAAEIGVDSGRDVPRSVMLVELLKLYVPVVTDRVDPRKRIDLTEYATLSRETAGAV